MPDWQALGDALAEFGIHATDLSAARAVGGGDISAAWHIQTDAGGVFLKTGGYSAADAFTAEADGLKELQLAQAVRVPEVLAVGTVPGNSFLALEWLELRASSAKCDRLFGERLALLHSHTADCHGWKRDNTIGNTPQINTWNDSWLDFYRDHRLSFQLELAARNGYSAELEKVGDALIENLPAFFAGYNPVPSLLHGDLWGGNWASVDEEPILFDPAVYYGDRESDLAMTRLFGGFSVEFYKAYEERWPFAAGHVQRRTIYQLYHVLNHLNLFGRAYLGQASGLMREALAFIR